jgi:hypothetical protein
VSNLFVTRKQRQWFSYFTYQPYVYIT